MSLSRRIILSCEHASNRVPRRYAKLFAADAEVLNTHRAYDIGIAPVARRMQKRLQCPYCRYPWTRLLVEVNRTHRGRLFSEYSGVLTEPQKQRLIEEFYLPYRDQLEAAVQRAAGPVLHVSMHSFTPRLKGEVRNADIGILYDPSRTMEKRFAERLQEYFTQRSELRIRRNYPYRGSADGMTTRLRRIYRQTRYLGIELELNQQMLTKQTPQQKKRLVHLLTEGLLQSL